MTQSSRRQVHPDYIQLRGVGDDPEWAPDASQTGGQVIARLMERLKLGERLKQNEIKERWPEIAGAYNASNSQPDTIKRGVLYIRVSNAPLKHQMEMFKGEFLKKIQAFAGKGTIREIKFVV